MAGLTQMKQAGWSTRKIALALYPFGAGAAAVNVFFASLIFSWVGGPVLSTSLSILVGAILGLPATWYFAKHIRHLIDVADEGAAQRPRL